MDFDQRLVGDEAAGVDSRGHQFLARPRRAPQEHGRVGRGDLLDAELDFRDAGRRADDGVRLEEAVAEGFLLRIIE